MLEVSLKSIGAFLISQCLLILIGVLIPSPFSLLLTKISISVAIIGFLIGLVAYYLQNRSLRLGYQLSVLFPFYMLSLRAWDIFSGLSWLLMTILFAGVALVVFLPYANKELAGFLYREQTAPITKIGKAIRIFFVGVLPISGIAGSMIGLYYGKNVNEYKILFLFLAIIIYIAILGFVFFIVYDYVTKPYRWKMRRATTSGGKLVK